MLKLSCFITGDDYRLAKEDTPGSRKKILTLASVLMIPVLMWFVIGFSLATTVFELPPLKCSFVGFVVSMIILIIERAILASGSNGWLIGFRLFMGFLIAALGSVFIDEVIFKKDIDQQVFFAIKGEISEEQGRIQSEYASIFSSEKLQMDKAYELWNHALDDARRESDGTGGSGVKGLHDIARLKLQIASQHESTYLSDKDRLEALQQELKSRLESARSEILSNIDEKSLLLRIKSLFKLVRKDKLVLAIYTFFTLLLFAFEFIVIIMKHSLAKTHYERRVEAMEVVGERRLAKIINRDSAAFDPADSSEPIRQVDRALSKARPSLFANGRA